VSPPSHWEVAAATVQPPRQRRRRSVDTTAAGQPVAAAGVGGGGGVLKEEPVQSPVTFHTPAAYCVTTIKLYATFSIYFRVRRAPVTRATPGD